MWRQLEDFNEMSNAQDLTKDNFDSTVADGVALIDFWANGVRLAV